MSDNISNIDPQDSSTVNTDDGVSLSSLDPSNTVDKHFINAGAFTVNNYDSSISADQSVVVVSDGKNSADNNPHNAQYLFSNKGIRTRGYAMSEGATSNWAKLGTRGVTVVVGTKAGGPSTGVNRYSEPEVDYLCDGTADDVEIQAALDSLPDEGGTVLLLDGTYVLAAPIVFPKAGITLQGCGKGTKLTWKQGLQNLDDFMVKMNKDNSCLRGMYLDLSIPSSKNYSTSGVKVSGERCVVEGVEVYNSYSDDLSDKSSYGIDMYSDYGVVRGCYVHGCGSYNDLYAIRAFGEYVTVEQNVCKDNRAAYNAYGIYVANDRAFVRGNACSNHKSTNYGSGYELYVWRNSIVEGNLCGNQPTPATYASRPAYGIYTQDYGNTITNNIVTGIHGTPSVDIRLAGDNVATGNQCFDDGEVSGEYYNFKIEGSRNYLTANHMSMFDVSATRANVKFTQGANGNHLFGNDVPETYTWKAVDDNTASTNKIVYTGTLEGGGSGIGDAPTDGKAYLRKSGNWAQATKADVGLGDVSLNSDNSISIGNNASATWAGIAIGQNASATEGGTAIGYGTSVTNGGVALGSSAETSDGAALGNNAESSQGGAVGNGAKAGEGGAVGSMSSADMGGAVGFNTKTGSGFVGGYNAKTVNSSGAAIDAIQLGTGTNTTAKSLQVYDYQLLNASGKIPKERISALPAALTFTGAANATYDGSGAVTVNIPTGGSGGSGLPQLTFTTRAAVTAAGSALDNLLDDGVYDILVHNTNSSSRQDLHALLVVSYDGDLDPTDSGAEHTTTQTLYWGDGTIQSRQHFYNLWIDWIRLGGLNLIQSGTGNGSVLLGMNNYPFGYDYAGASGEGSVSIPTATALGYRAIALGSEGYAEGDSSIVFGGEGGRAKGYGSIAAGLYTISNEYQLATGVFNVEKPGPLAGTTDASLFIVGNGNNTTDSDRSNAFRVAKSGSCYGTGAFNTTGADYAEYFEWADGNPAGEDRRGKFVTLDGDNIRLAAASDDYVLGAISSVPGVVGDSYSDGWQGRYLTDVFGKVLTEFKSVPEHTEVRHIDEVKDEDGNVVRAARDVEVTVPAFEGLVPVLSPDYDPTKPYIPREQRPEWGCVGMMGKLIVCDDGTCKAGGYCKAADGGIATAAAAAADGWRVMRRVDEAHVMILFR